LNKACPTAPLANSFGATIMSDLERVSISLDETLLKKLDGLSSMRGYENRSEFIRDMIREKLVENEWETSHATVVGTLTLIYDHHQRDLAGRLVDIQHNYHHIILATTHVHLNHDLCAEVIMMKGPPASIQKMSDALRRERGVLHGALSFSSTGQSLR
jgi:CopG family nickel-responsive transcriptional regulator